MRVDVGRPVGSSRTALVDTLCKHMRDSYEIAVVGNDIYTREGAKFLIRSGAFSVEIGSCPHTAIREDVSMNLAAADDLARHFPVLDLPAINRINLAPYVRASLEVVCPNAARMRRARPFALTDLKIGGLSDVASFLEREGGL
nr:GTP-binding protein [Acidiferrobacter sp.]